MENNNVYEKRFNEGNIAYDSSFNLRKTWYI